MEKNMDERSLLKAFNKYEFAAMKAVHEKFYNSLAYYASNLVQSKSVGEDITMEAFELLFMRQGNNFHTLGSIKSYLYDVINKKAQNIFRHQRVKSRHEEQLRYLQEISEETIFHNLIQAELLNEVFHQVNLLKPGERNVMLLTLREGLKIPEIANRLKISIQTARNYQNQGIENVRNAILRNSGFNIILLYLLAGASILCGIPLLR